MRSRILRGSKATARHAYFVILAMNAEYGSIANSSDIAGSGFRKLVSKTLIFAEENPNDDKSYRTL